jgi:hypothetical protein
MVTATSTRCTARYPDLGIELRAGIPTSVPNDPEIIAALKQVEGVVVEEIPTPAATPTRAYPHEEN